MTASFMFATPSYVRRCGSAEHLRQSSWCTNAALLKKQLKGFPVSDMVKGNDTQVLRGGKALKKNNPKQNQSKKGKNPQQNKCGEQG